MVIKNMSELLEHARKSKKKTIGVVAAEDDDVLGAIKIAVSENFQCLLLSW